MLKQDGLYYFQDDEQKEPKGLVLLGDSYLASEEQNSMENNRIAICHKTRTCNLEVEKQEDKGAWIIALQKVMDNLWGSSNKENKRNQSNVQIIVS